MIDGELDGIMSHQSGTEDDFKDSSSPTMETPKTPEGRESTIGFTIKDVKDGSSDKECDGDESKKSIWSKIYDFLAAFGYFVVAVFEFSDGGFMSGMGWILAGVGWWAFSKEKEYAETFIGLYRNRLNECEKREEEYKAKMKECEVRLSGGRNAAKEAAFDVDRMDFGDHSTMPTTEMDIQEPNIQVCKEGLDQ